MGAKQSSTRERSRSASASSKRRSTKAPASDSVTKDSVLHPLMLSPRGSPRLSFALAPDHLMPRSPCTSRPGSEASTPLSSPRHSPGTANSCWTINTCSHSGPANASLATMLHCAAVLVVRSMVENRVAGRSRTHAAFEEDTSACSTIPSVTCVESFLCSLCSSAQGAADTAIVMIVYVHRLLYNNDIALSPSNWRCILLGAFVVAAKVWDDAVWSNGDVCDDLPIVSVQELNQLERVFLRLIAFAVQVKASEFTVYYFLLRDIAVEQGMHLDLRPMPPKQQQLFQLHTSAYAELVAPRDNLAGSTSPPSKSRPRRSVSESDVRRDID